MKSKIMISVLLLMIYTAGGLFGGVRISSADSNPPDQPCSPFFTRYNTLFENYEDAEYPNGYLNLHLKLLMPFGGGGWFQSISFQNSDCTMTQSFDVPVSMDQMQLPIFLKDFSVRFSSRTHYDIWDDDNNVMLQCKGCSVDIPSPTFPDGKPYSYLDYNAHTGDLKSLLYSSSFPVYKDVPKHEPVVIIPGILGTEFLDSQQVVWPNIQQIALDPSDKILDELDLDSSGLPKMTQTKPEGVLSKIGYAFGDFDYSDALEKDFEAKGYVKDRDLFLIGYDWRLSAQDNANFLEAKIEQVVQANPGQKINFIAHSFGGLVLKQYLFQLSDAKFIDKVIFVGTPNLGTPAAAKALLFGDGLGIPLLNPEEVHKIVQNMPSIYDLLPSSKYFEHSPGFYDDLTDLRNKTILNYQQSQDFLKANGENASLLQSAADLHSGGVDNFDFKSMPYKTYNLIGCGINTFKTINKMYAGQPSFTQKLMRDTKYRIYEDSGDGNVILNSADALNIDPQQRYFVPGAKHAEMLSNASVRHIISDIIESGSSTGVSHTEDRCSLNGKLISLPSDLEYKIIDEKGNQIPEQQISEDKIGKQTFVYLSDDEKYTLIANSENVSKNPVNVELAEYKDNSIKNYLYDNLDLNAKELHMSFSDNNKQVYVSDQNGANSNPITPTEEDDFGSDLSAPVTKIKNSAGLYSTEGRLALSQSDRKISFEASDDSSGVAATYYSFNDGQDWHLFSNTLLEVPQDLGRVLFYSEDHAGNQEDIKTVYFDWNDQNPTPTPIIIQNQPAPSTSVTQNPAEVDGSTKSDEQSSANSQDSNNAPDLNKQVTVPSNSEVKISLNLNFPPNTDSTRVQTEPAAPINRNTIIVQENPYLFIWNKAKVLAHLIFNLMIF